MILTACTDDDDETELFGSNNGGVEVEQSFQKFSPAAFLTNKCLQCRSTNENIVKFWLWFNLKFRTTIWPNRELQEGFDLRKFRD